MPCERLLLSTGMACKLLAARGQKVQLADGTVSNDKMHPRADGAGVISHPSDGGWYYMSNSEFGNDKGGVGSLRFDASGNVIGYERTLTGTNRNCGGGGSVSCLCLQCIIVIFSEFVIIHYLHLLSL